MASEKKGFVLYFDACTEVMTLPPEQRGWLLTAVVEFARACAEDGEADLEATLARFPELRPEAAMAYRFLCGGIARDTKKWRQRRENLSQAARARQGRGTDKDRGDNSLREYVQDLNGKARKYV